VQLMLESVQNSSKCSTICKLHAFWFV